MFTYLLKVNDTSYPNNAFENIMQFFLLTSKFIPKAAKHGMRKREGTWKVDRNVKVMTVGVY